MGRVLLLLVGVATLLFPRAASADAVSWQFYGSVVSVYPGKESILPLGSPVQIGFSYDLNAPNLCGSQYNGVSGLFQTSPVSMTAGSYALASSGFLEAEAPLGTCTTTPGIQFGTSLRMPTLHFETGLADWAGVPPFSFTSAITAFFNPVPTGIFPDADPLGGYPAPATFGSAAFSAQGIVTPVPEPGTLALFGTGVIVATRRWRSRSRR